MHTGRRLSVALGSAAVAVALTISGCADNPQPLPGATTATAPPAASPGPPPPNAVAGEQIPPGQVSAAVGRIDQLADDLMASSHIPGMAVAVVHDGKVVYRKGFGVRNVDTGQKVDPDTVFQLASVSKSIAATTVAHEVGKGLVTWDTPVHQLMPQFELSDPYVTDHVTVGDLFAHRSGLPEHAGDLLEDLGDDRQQILARLKLLPLAPFRDSYAYTNFGLTAAAQGVADAAGTDWATLSQQALYGPLGMSSTSSRFADFEARPDRAAGHVLVDGRYQVSDPPRQPDAQSPAGGVSSSVDDLAKWMNMVLANGTADGKTIVPAQDLLPAISPQAVSSPPTTPDARAGFYGYGFNVGNSAAGRVVLSHSGAFDLGAGTAFTLIPSANVGIVTLTNAAPIGVPETLDAEFADLVQFGAVKQDWGALYKKAFAAMNEPTGSLAGKTPPKNPAPAGPLADYAGTYANDYYGPATVTVANDTLSLTLGPKNMTFPLTHWSGGTFVFTPPGENGFGQISAATFHGNDLRLEFYDKDHLGTFTRG
ncbi:serine hydrolase [Speluncibacter jeojiensis]|uniref:Serine hydrolase n=1 Tax=Speluncibacter jeojiensis TaxID=2710754 RepID=A0A9X4LYG9_9ACTN|nr:serine hydrolase [Corynebacteriales bacterium D3-21]